jgi:sulfatase maturation enzyme AslB (radical SAM superfamily)
MNVSACDQPWFELQLEYNAHARCCCYYHDVEDRWDAGGFDIARLWNSPIMRRKRGIVASGAAEGTGCDGCQYLKYATGSRFTSIPADVNALQRANWQHALADFEAKRIVVESWPIKYYMNFGLACNIDCIHCCQTGDRGRDGRQLPVEPLLRMKEHLVRAHEFAIIGGEPLAVKSSRTFIDAVLADPDYADVQLSLYTNGTLLHQYLERLQAQRKVAVCLSLDSSGDAFEYIRKGGSWEVVERNILAFKEAGLARGLAWRVNVAAVVMKTSLAHLVPFVDWCIRHDFPVHFVPLLSQTAGGALDTDAEDIFQFPELLDEMPGWEDIFDQAIERLTQKGWRDAGAGPLALMKEELRTKRELARREAHVCRLRGRVAAMLRRPSPISLVELEEATRTLEGLVRAPDAHAYVDARHGTLPEATAPLLLIYLEAAREAGNAALAHGLERLCGVVGGAGPAATA